jgi:hypothetical protein
LLHPSGAFDITGITGTFTANGGQSFLPITGIVPVGYYWAGLLPIGSHSNDNDLWAFNGNLDDNGLAFSVGDMVSVDLYWNNAGSYGIQTAAFGYDLENGSWAVTLDPPPATTPLPGALPLFVAGLTVIGFLTRKGRSIPRSRQ